jgi:hypothetical protein
VLKTAIFIYYDWGLNLSYSLLQVDLAHAGITPLTVNCRFFSKYLLSVDDCSWLFYPRDFRIGRPFKSRKPLTQASPIPSGSLAREQHADLYSPHEL